MAVDSEEISPCFEFQEVQNDCVTGSRVATFCRLVASALGLGTGTGSAHAGQGGGSSRAKACIFVFLFGSPPQHETFDPKPLAAAEIQGEMQAIDTVVPGLQICEGLPQIARIADRLTVVRSMTHEYPIHCCAYVMTGMPTYSIPLETSPRDPQQWPFMGSVVDYLDGRRSGTKSPAMPRNVGLPWRFCSKGSSSDQAGPYAAFLGNNYDPFWSSFEGPGTVIVPKLNADGQTEDVRDPHAGIDATGRFQLSDGCQLPQELSAQRFDARVHLLQQFDATRPLLDRAAEIGNYNAQQQRAFSLIGSNRIREALDVGRESHAMRERYGISLFGQSCLAARRLVEAALVLCQYSGIRSGLTAHPYGIRIQIISRDSEIICYQSSIRVIPR